MKLKLCRLLLILGLVQVGHAAVPPAEKLLPADTLGVMSVPDLAKAKAAYTNSPLGQLWQDLEMKPFQEKFLEKFKTDVVVPLERELGVKLADYVNLAKGQLTVAWTQNGWEGKTNHSPGFLLLLDTKDKSELLKKNLADVKQKWVDSGKQLKSEKIRDLEFTTLIVNREDIAKALKNVFPQSKDDKDDAAEDAQKSTNKTELIIGQSESLLLVGTSPNDLEKVLIRQSGGPVPALSEQPAFEAKYGAMFRDALVYGWLNFKAVADALSREMENDAADGVQPLKPTKVFDALGLRQLNTLAFNVVDAPDGALLSLFVGAPEGERKGLFKVLNVDAKDSQPPPFVPADVVKFSRWRLDGQKAWATLESMLVEMSPQMSGVLKLLLESAGKDKDPSFDLRKSFFGNLGDDFVSYQKNPRANSPAEKNPPAAVVLIGSPSPEKLANALKTISSLIPSETGVVKEREFLGRKIYSLPLPPTANSPGNRGLNYSASGSFLALSTDVALLEEYLRSAETQAKALRENVGLNEAAQKVGGMSTGFFGYENNSETMRVTFEALKRNPDGLGKNFSPLASVSGDKMNPKQLKEWFDFTLLPPFERVAKYFNFSVYAAAVRSDGFYLNYFAPLPPQLKK